MANRTAPAAEQLRTLDLYFEMCNVNDVGAVLGISGSAVASRLRTIGVTLMRRGVLGQSPDSVNDPASIQRLRADLVAQAKRESDAGEFQPVDAVDIRDCYRQGWPAEKIAKRFDISTSTVLRVLRKDGLTRPRGPVSAHLDPRESVRTRRALREVRRSISQPLRLNAPAPALERGEERTWADLTPCDAADPFAEFQKARLYEIVGDVDPGELNEFELARLRRAILDAGLAAPAVQVKERERLRDPARHRGEAPPVPWQGVSSRHRGRKEQKALMAGKRTSRKQPKGWKRA